MPLKSKTTSTTPMEVLNAVNLWSGIHGEGNTVEAAATDYAGKAARVIRLPHCPQDPVQDWFRTLWAALQCALREIGETNQIKTVTSKKIGNGEIPFQVSNHKIGSKILRRENETVMLKERIMNKDETLWQMGVGVTPFPPQMRH